MFGCLTNFNIWIYLNTRYVSARSLILLFSSILIATFSFVNLCVPIFTLPNVPYPIVFPKYTQIYRLYNFQTLSYLSWDFYSLFSFDFLDYNDVYKFKDIKIIFILTITYQVYSKIIKLSPLRKIAPTSL